MGEVLRYDIYEAWNGSMNIDIDQDGGEWVSYEDHAKEIATLRGKWKRAVDHYRLRETELRAENDRPVDEAEERVIRLALALREIRTMVNSGSEEMHIIDEALHPNHAFGGWALNEDNE